jgi:ATP-dependent Clp protease adaptor protein ClpS
MFDAKSFFMSTKEKKHVQQDSVTKNQEVKKLILWNDNVNTFDYVIEVLIEVCGHNPYQAETCALIAHYKGKCAVKVGSLDELKPMKDEMTIRELTVEIK